MLGTLIPAYAGLFGAVALGRSKPQYLAAIAIGIFLWFFSDTIGDSSYLGVNEGVSGGLSHVALVMLFATALVLFFLAEGRVAPANGLGLISSSLAIPILVAIALSIHGAGEGAGFGGAASSTSGASLIEAFGGYGPAVSYILHKVLEPIAIGVCYSTFYLNPGKQGTPRWKNLAVAGAVFVIPTLIGTTAGYLIPFDTTYLFAAGVGASVYVLFKLMQALFEPASPFRSYRESMRIAFLALLGFALIYAAAILHSVSG